MDDDFYPMDISDSDDDESYEREPTYKVLSIEQVNQKMHQIVDGIESSTGIPAPVIRIALSQFDWDKWIVLGKFYDDPDKFFEKINVRNPLNDGASTSTATTHTSASSSRGTGTAECLTCFEELPLHSLVGLSCNHLFCKDCWSQYLTVKVNMGAELISCQNLDCKIFIDDPTVASLLTDPEIRARHKRWITNSFVLSDSFLSWCPGANCNKAIEASCTPIHKLNCTCECGHEFCFECQVFHHEPIPCYLFKIWQTQSSDATLRYMLKNAKPCPKCGCLIEKNHGCDYMYCIRCRTEFCWVCFKKCFANWKFGHGRCNTPKEERPSVNQHSIRYQRYNSSYESHKLLLERDKVCIQLQIENAAKPTEGGLMQSDIKYLQKSFEIVLACRKSLMMSCIFAYFVVEGNQKTIFEENQRDLENAVQILSNQLQEDKTYKAYAESNIRIMDKTEYCSQRRTKLHDHITEGLDKRWWTFYNE